MKEAAERNVVGALRGGRARALQIVVAGRAEEFFAAELLAGSASARIVGAHMHTVRIDRARQRQIVIDDQRGRVAPAHCAQRPGLLAALTRVGDSCCDIARDARRPRAPLRL